MAKKRKLPYVPVEYQPPEEQQQTQEQVEDEEQTQEQNQDPQEEQDQVEEEEQEQEQEEEDYEDEITEQDYQDFQKQEEEKEKEDLENNPLNKTHEKEYPDEDFQDEPLEKLLDPLAKDQLVTLLKEFVTKYPDLIHTLYSQADSDPAHRKIFVHGLGWDTNTDTLKTLFSEFGEIEDCKLVTDKVSGKSKGYAFILFKARSGAKKALRVPQKSIGNRTASCQLACEGPVPAPHPSAPAVPVPAPVSEYTQRKIFVSNVGADVDPVKLVEFFGQFGEIEEGPLGIDKYSGKFKGFCLFVYRSVEGAKKALEEPHKPFEGTTLHCKKAVDGPLHGKPQQNQQGFRRDKRPFGGHGGGRGGGRGGGHGQGHMMAPSGPSMGFNPAASNLAPVLGQALSALLANQGAGGIGNLLGGLNQQQQGMNSQGGYNQGYNQQYNGGYGPPQQGGGYQNQQMGGGPPYMGHGR